METYIIVILVLLLIGAVSYAIYTKKKNKNAIDDENNDGGIVAVRKTSLTSDADTELAIKFEDLPALTKIEENSLVEVKDPKLLARIDSVVPGAGQVLANAGAVHSANEAVNSVGKVYQAILKKGGELVESKDMQGAVRGFTRNAQNIEEQANFVAVDIKSPVQKLANANIANATMSAASMVVGQYYMSQINDQLGGISDNISKLADFQDNEYKSKVCKLVAEVQKIATFQVETMENDDVRNRELIHLKELESECGQLLIQSNLALDGYSKNKNLEYAKYEKLVGEAQHWYQYQQILIQVMRQIADLTYALNLGAISRENSMALLIPYANQAKASLDKLNAWHESEAKKLEIDIDAVRRKRQGVGGFFMNIPALFKDDLHYKAISESTANMITSQSKAAAVVESGGTDLYQEDVRLVMKDGKLFYLPSTH